MCIKMQNFIGVPIYHALYPAIKTQVHINTYLINCVQEGLVLSYSFSLPGCIYLYKPDIQYVLSAMCSIYNISSNGEENQWVVLYTPIKSTPWCAAFLWIYCMSLQQINTWSQLVIWKCEYGNGASTEPFITYIYMYIYIKYFC